MVFFCRLAAHGRRLPPTLTERTCQASRLGVVPGAGRVRPLDKGVLLGDAAAAATPWEWVDGNGGGGGGGGGGRGGARGLAELLAVAPVIGSSPWVGAALPRWISSPLAVRPGLPGYGWPACRGNVVVHGGETAGWNTRGKSSTESVCLATELSPRSSRWPPGGRCPAPHSTMASQAETHDGVVSLLPASGGRAAKEGGGWPSSSRLRRPGRVSDQWAATCSLHCTTSSHPHCCAFPLSLTPAHAYAAPSHNPLPSPHSHRPSAPALFTPVPSAHPLTFLTPHTPHTRHTRHTHTPT